MDAYTTIRGAEKHSVEHQQHVDRAVDVLFKEFGESYAGEVQLRWLLANPRHVLLVSDKAVALVLAAGKEGQKLHLMWVEEEVRGHGLGGALLQYILSTYDAADHLMELNCPAARENFYKRHGFHRTYTATEGAYVYMAGPGENESDVLHRLPEGHPARVIRSQPLESLPWACPECNSTNGATVVRCHCGYTFPGN